MSIEINEMLKQHKEIEEKLELTRKELVAPLSARITEEVLRLFEKQSNLTAIRWTQYTPYFNDGDVCEFRVNEIEFRLDGEQYEEEYDWDYINYGHRNAPEFAPLMEFSETLSSIPEDIMSVIFGDGFQISCNRGDTTLTVEEYEHD